MNISYDDYLRRVRGCFLGKTVGGTLGMPFEGDLNERTVTYYDPIPTTMLPNDDLDLQVVHLEHVLEYGLPVSVQYLGELWLHNMVGYPDEYGVADANITHGILPPFSGIYNNFFHGGMGAAIRSELWACLCPGDPALAARLARQDASIDHMGDGLEAEMFLTAVESCAFVESDFEKLFICGLQQIPQSGRLSSALRSTRQWWEELHDAHAVRCRILEQYPTDNWTDVSVNLSLIILSWLAGKGDFSKGICCAAGLGYDADCTCATLGSILGILNPDGIGERWTKPIGDELVLSPGMMGLHEPETVEEFCDRIIGIAPQVLSYYHSPIELTGYPESKKIPLPEPWTRYPDVTEWDADTRCAVLALQPLTVELLYPGKSVTPGEPSQFSVTVKNPSDVPFEGSLRLSVPDGWTVTPAVFPCSLQPGKRDRYAFTVIPASADKRRSNYNPLRFQFSSGGLSWTCTAGLPFTTPWLRRALPGGDWESVEATGNFQTVPAGRWEYRGKFKVSSTEPYARLNVQSYRHTVTWLDGEMVADYDGSVYLPAFHRSPAVVPVKLTNGEHTVTITVEDGKETEIFAGFSNQRDCGRWLSDIEWVKMTAGEQKE